MLRNRITRISILMALVLSLQAVQGQAGPEGGLYQIVSGNYIECCGFAGAIRRPLPYSSQSYIRLSIDSEHNGATMAFLGSDQRTVFSIVACPSGPPVGFTFDHGFVYPNQIFFHADPGPTPAQAFWSYTVSNSITSLRVDGTLGRAQHLCADLPDRFTHTNVVATLLPAPPVIEGLERTGDLVRFRFNGQPSNDYFVEFIESFPAAPWLTLTNVRVKIQPKEIVITDSISHNPGRFYRLRQQDCQCD